MNRKVIEKAKSTVRRLRSAWGYFHRNFIDWHLFIYLVQQDNKLRERSRQEIEQRMSEEEELTDILDTVLEVKPGERHYQLSAVQLEEELYNFCKFAEDKEPKTVVEIGTHYGGTLYVFSRYFDSASRIASIDLPHRFNFVEEWQDETFPGFSSSKEIQLIRGDSHKKQTFERLSSNIDEIDLLFIDGDHTYEGVKKDFEMYSKLMSEDGIVAFHDIIPHADSEEHARKLVQEKDIDSKYVTPGHDKLKVAKFWEEISSDYESKEFISHPQQRGKGIGAIQL